MADEKKTFTQAQIDNAVESRLARERKKHNEKLEEIRNNPELPEGATDYKQIYEDKHEEYLQLLKQSKLIAAGFPIDQVENYTGYLEGETEEEIEEEANLLAEDVFAEKQQYADPSQKKKKKSAWNPFK